MNDFMKMIEPFFIPREVPVTVLKTILEPIYKIEISGEEHVPKSGGAILVCNHTDNLDALIQGVYFPRKVTFLAKYEIFNPQGGIVDYLNDSNNPLKSNPIYEAAKGFVIDGLNSFGEVYSKQIQSWGGMPIIRNFHGEDAKSAVAYYEELENYMVSILKSGEIISIFPEGTRTLSGVMGSFKALAAKIAIRAGVPIIPSGISGAWNMSNPKAIISGRARKTIIKYNIGVPILPDSFPKEAEKKSSKILTEELEKKVYFLSTNAERRGTPRRFATKL